MAEEFDETFEMVPISPVRRLEKRVQDIEKAGTIPQLQSLITQIIDMIRTNQKLVGEIVKADNDLKNELAKLPIKMDELVSTMKSFMDLVKVAGEEEVAVSPASMQPIAEQFQKMVEQNQKMLDQNQRLVESNQQVLGALGEINRKLKAGTPVSTIMSAYPRLRLRGEQK